MKIKKKQPLRPRGRSEDKRQSTKNVIRDAYINGPQKEVQIIPAKRDMEAETEKKKLRVCAYCRVSTDEDTQASSYELQVQNYTRMIRENPEWEFAGIFADEGISGTSVLHREHFLEMIEKCKAGEIDLMAMKVLYEKESLRLLGAQIVGGEGVDKRIDVLATAIRAKMTALELTELDLSYAPPYSSAKDPVNMAGFMIEDLESGKVRQFHWNDVEDLPRDGSAMLLDVRTEGEYRRGHLNGFRNIPLDDLREHLDELERDKPVYVNCQTGLRSYLACRLLTQYGFTCTHLSGGYSFYQVVTQERQIAQSAYPCGMEKL